jgi:hypothetical protein
MKISHLVSLLCLPVAFIKADGPGGTSGFETCDEQAQCIEIFQGEPLSGGIGACDLCTVRVCLTINYEKPGCQKTGTISHVCTKNKSDMPDTCLRSPYNFDKIDDIVSDVADATTYCVEVPSNEDVVFILKDDGSGAVCTALSGNSENFDLPPFVTCKPSTDSNYDSMLWDETNTNLDIESCAGDSNAGNECVWVVPTVGIVCTEDPRTPEPTDPPAPPPTMDDPNTPPPSTTGGSIGGDPHIRTWNGEKFDYNGACDLVLVHSDKFANGLGLDIHVRTKHRGVFSYITSAAMRIGNEVLEVTGKNGLYYLNGVSNAALPATIAGFSITHKQPSDHQHTYFIKVNHGQTIVIKTWRDIVSVTIEHATAADFGDAVGLMGDFVTGHKRSRNGSVMDDVDAYGQEWQVREDELKLFQTVEAPQYPQQCMLPSASTKSTARRRLGEGISEAAAKAACAHASATDFEFCVYDVMTMNDVDVAGAY